MLILGDTKKRAENYGKLDGIKERFEMREDAVGEDARVGKESLFAVPLYGK